MAYSTTVEVTQEDIDAALRKDSSRCVVATAIARTYPKAARIVVDVHSIKFTDGARRYTYLTPPKVVDYVVAFDAGDTLHPFTFRLRTDQRLVQQRTVKTPKGKAADAAEQKVRSRQRKLEATESNPAATAAEREVAADRYAVALADRDAAMAAAGQQTQPEDMSEVAAPEVRPRIRGRSTTFHRNVRNYGHRVMRVNQHDDAPGDFRGPLDNE